MAVRTDESLVAGVIEVDEDIPLTPFISAASILVDRVSAQSEKNKTLVNAIYFLEPKDSSDPSVDQQLQTIETWLAAHFYAMRDPRPTQEGAGSVNVTYQSAVDLNLYTSHYGQMAMVLDVTNTLRNLSAGKRHVASVSWLGKSCR